MSIEALTWPTGAEIIADAQDAAAATTSSSRSSPSQDAVAGALRMSESDVKELFQDEQPDSDGDGESMEAIATGQPLRLTKWDLDSDRLEVWNTMERNRRAVWRWLVQGKGRKYASAFGIVLADDPSNPRATIYRNSKRIPTVEVHSVRTALRRDARGSVVTDLIIELTQRRRGYFNPEEQKRMDAKLGAAYSEEERGDFKYRAGCTIVVDTTKSVFRHIIRTPGTIADDDELERVRQYVSGDADPTANAFDGMRVQSLREKSFSGLKEPFALLHRHSED
jgi:hypothetical protein